MHVLNGENTRKHACKHKNIRVSVYYFHLVLTLLHKRTYVTVTRLSYDCNSSLAANCEVDLQGRIQEFLEGGGQLA